MGIPFVAVSVEGAGDKCRMRPFVSLLCLLSLLGLGPRVQAALTRLKGSGHQMPSWDEFDLWLSNVAKGHHRPERSADGEHDPYDNSISDPDYEDYHFDKSLERQDYFTAVDVVANKLRRQGGNRILFNVPQSSVPDAIINVAALGPIVTFAYAFARDQMMETDITNLKKKVEDARPIHVRAKAICSKVTELTSAQGCGKAGETGCQDEVVDPPNQGTFWFTQGSDLINKLIAVTDLPTSVCPE